MIARIAFVPAITRTLRAIRPTVVFAASLAGATAFLGYHPEASGWTRTVCQSGCDYARIDTAITHFPSLGPGDTVQVNEGTYTHSVKVSGVGGSVASPAVIRANGAVTIDGSNPLTSWTLCAGSTYYTSIAIPTPDTTYVDRQLFVGDTRCRYVADAWQNCSGMDIFTYSYDATNTRLYLKVKPGFGPPSGVYISDRADGLDLQNCNNIVIQGFAVLRTRARGIRVWGSSLSSRSRNVRIKNCTFAYNWNRGMHLQAAAACSLLNNSVYSNGKHGIYLHIVDSSAVRYNHSFSNNDPVSSWGGNAGIKIGDSTSTASTTYVTVDYNTVHDNEDSGIDLRGSSNIWVRRNVSYQNHDHGYDNLNTDYTTFLNNVSARNDHDGFSIEPTASHVTAVNNILWHNGLNGATLVNSTRVRELYVGSGTGLALNHNIICGLAPDTTGVEWQRWLVEFPSNQRYGSWSYYRASQPTFDAQSRPFDPAFVDSASADWRLNSVFSAAVDSGNADLPGWLSTDPRGFVPHDNDSIPNGGGAGSPNYAEIGAFEYDIAPAAMDSVIVDVVTSTSIHLKWRGSGDDGRVGRAPSACLRMSQGVALTEATFGTPSGNTVPGYPATWRDTTYTGLPNCTLYYFALKYGGGNNLWGDIGDTARVITTPEWYQGQWVCDGELRAGGEYSASRRHPERSSRGLAAEREAAPLTAGEGNPICVDVTPMSGGLDVKVVMLRAEEAPGYQQGGGAGIVYQEPDGGGGWVTRLKYSLPPGPNLTLLAPEKAGRWVFLEPLVVRGIPTTIIGDDTAWQLEQARHSREGDVTNTLTLGENPTFNAGDTLTAVYTTASVAGGSHPSGLVVLDSPDAGIVASRAVDGRPEANSGLPAAFALHQNQPNPFTSATTLRFDLPKSTTVRLDLFDVAGRRVAVLHDSWMPAGRHSLDWNGRDADGAAPRPGAYLCRMTAGSFRAERKLVVLP